MPLLFPGALTVTAYEIMTPAATAILLLYVIHLHTLTYSLSLSHHLFIQFIYLYRSFLVVDLQIIKDVKRANQQES